MPDIRYERLPNVEAQKHFDAKALLTTHHYAELKAYEHALAFTVAKIADQDMLFEVHKAVKQAIDNGTSFADFKKTLKPYLIAKGWLGLTDSQSDQTYLGYRLKTIYHTNKQTAYAAGRWQRIQRTKETLPYLQYLPSLSTDKRDSHTAYYGLVRPVDDPIWQSIFPPNGFGCKCRTKQLTKKQAEQILAEQTKEGKSYDIEIEQVKRPLTGEMVSTPKGVHFSFNHNHDRLTAMLKLAEDKHGGEFSQEIKEQLAQHFPEVLSKTPEIKMDKALNHDRKSDIDDLSQSDIIKKWVNDDVRIEKWLDLYERLYKRQFNLTADEFIALRYYTANGYQGINRYLNGIDAPKEETKALFERIKPFLNDVIDKLPIDKKHKKLYRWLYLPDEVLEKYQTGEIVEFNAFTSTTHDKDKKVDLTGDSNVKFIIKHKTGRWIEQMSQHQSEKEVLLPTNTRHMVISRTQKKATKEYPAHTLIELEEIT